MHMLSHWIHLHPHLAGLAAFLIAFGESLALLGLLIPGSVTMGAVGTLVGAGAIPAMETFIWASIGAVLGDAISYWLGYRFHGQIRNLWPISLFPKWLNRGETFFEQHGGKSVFFGRFIGPMRPIIPLLAGVMRMRLRHFLPICCIAACAWAPLYMFPGILIGAAAMEASHQTIIAFLFKGFFPILLSLFLLNTARIFLENKAPQYKKFFGSLWLLTLVTLFIGLLLFLFLNGSFIPFNDQIAQAFHLHYQRHYALLMQSVTLFADKRVMLIQFFVVGLWLVGNRQRDAARFWLTTAVVGVVATHLIKQWVAYPRPPYAMLMIPSDDFSFPSGHTTLITLSVGMLLVFARSYWSGYKKEILNFLGCSMIALIMLSRLYLGVHWPSDVIGGVLLGLIAIQSMVLLLRSRPSVRELPPLSFKSFLIVYLAAGLLPWAVLSVLKF